MSLANIEGDDIVIRIPIKSIADAAKVAFDEEYGFEEHSITVTDNRLAAEAIVRQLNDEEEDGTTLVHQILDKAVTNAFEDGDEGFSDGTDNDTD